MSWAGIVANGCWGTTAANTPDAVALSARAVVSFIMGGMDWGYSVTGLGMDIWRNGKTEI